MKKIILLLSTVILVVSISFGQTCILVGNDTVAFNSNNLTALFTDDSYEVERYDFGYLNEKCSWDTLYTYYFLEQGIDTLKTNDSVTHITHVTGVTEYDTIIRETWTKEFIMDWTKEFTSMNGYSQSLTWGDNDTMTFDIFYDNVGGISRFWRTMLDDEDEVTIFNEYEFNSNGDIIEETIRIDGELHRLYKYEYDGNSIIKLNHYPSEDNLRWVVEDIGDVVIIQFQYFDSFFWEWVLINEAIYPICWFYVGIEELPQPGNVLELRYYNILGQSITKPKQGFYIEQKITSTGTTTKKYYIQ